MTPFPPVRVSCSSACLGLVAWSAGRSGLFPVVLPSAVRRRTGALTAPRLLLPGQRKIGNHEMEEGP
jgi:hypothetical protein